MVLSSRQMEHSIAALLFLRPFPWGKRMLPVQMTVGAVRANAVHCDTTSCPQVPKRLALRMEGVSGYFRQMVGHEVGQSARPCAVRRVVCIEGCRDDHSAGSGLTSQVRPVSVEDVLVHHGRGQPRGQEVRLASGHGGQVIQRLLLIYVAGWLLACDVAEPVLDKTTPVKPLEEAMERMSRYELESMPVVAGEDNDELVGVLDYRMVNRKISAEVLRRRKIADGTHTPTA